jgi:hypothetical protein
MMQKLFYRPLRGGLFAILGLTCLHARAEAPMPPAAVACMACHGTAAVGSLDGGPGSYVSRTSVAFSSADQRRRRS